MYYLPHRSLVISRLSLSPFFLNFVRINIILILRNKILTKFRIVLNLESIVDGATVSAADVVPTLVDLKAIVAEAVAKTEKLKGVAVDQITARVIAGVVDVHQQVTLDQIATLFAGVCEVRCNVLL